MRYCVSPISKVGYLLRVVHPDITVVTLGPLDEALYRVVATMVGVPELSEESQAILSLPIKCGGLGIRSVTECAPWSYVDCLKKCKVHTDYVAPTESIYDHAHNCVARINLALPDQEIYGITEEEFNINGAYLHALPHDKRMFIANEVMVCSLRVRLFIKPDEFLSSPNHPQPRAPGTLVFAVCPLCNSWLTPTHPTFCRKVWSQVIFRHNSLSAQFATLLKQRQCTARLEPRRTNVREFNNAAHKRPDVEYCCGTDDLTHALDVVVSSGPASVAEARKDREYTEDKEYLPLALRFTPLVFDSIGRLNARGAEWCKTALKLKIYEKTTLSVLFQRLNATVYQQWFRLAVQARWAQSGRHGEE